MRVHGRQGFGLHGVRWPSVRLRSRPKRPYPRVGSVHLLRERQRGSRMNSCKRCGRKPRGRMQIASAERYAPFCSYQCQQWYNLEDARAYLAELREEKEEEAR